MAYKVIDLFAGAGGLSLGFMQTGKFEIVAAAENNPGARKTYKRNHKLARLYPDVRTIDYNELAESCGEIDVVIGGPPCQGFSNANRQHTTIISMNNRLVKEYVRAVQELKPKAFVMENVAMLKSNIHRFMVEETDINDPIIMGLTLSEDKIELLSKGINFPDAVDFAKDPSNIKTYMWDEKELKAITVLYRFRINELKFSGSVERYRKYLTKLLTDIVATNDDDWIRTQEREMAHMLLAYMHGEEVEFNALIRAIEIPLSVQRMLSRMKELLDNNIHVTEYRTENGAVIAAVQSYAVFDYVDSVLSATPYNYDITAKVYNALDYGAPQKRERFIIVGTKKGIVYDPPKPEFTSDTFRTVRDAIADLQNVPATTEIDAPPIELSRMDNLFSPLFSGCGCTGSCSAARYSPTEGSRASSLSSFFSSSRRALINLVSADKTPLASALFSARSISHFVCWGFSSVLRYSLSFSPSMYNTPAKGISPLIFPLSVIFIPVRRTIATLL